MTGNYVGPGDIGANKFTKSLEEYRGLFKKAKLGQLCGDISPDYLYYYQNAVPKILNEINAQLPIVIILRNPIDRAYSNYLHHVRERKEDLSFEDALKVEDERRAANWAWGWSYMAVGLYAEQVKAWFDGEEEGPWIERMHYLLVDRDTKPPFLKPGEWQTLLSNEELTLLERVARR